MTGVYAAMILLLALFCCMLAVGFAAVTTIDYDN